MKYIPWVIVVILIIIITNKCSVIDSQQTYMNLQDDSAQVYKDKITGQQVYYNEVVEIHKKVLKQVRADNKILDARLRKFKKPKSVTTIKTLFNIDTLYIPIKPVNLFSEESAFDDLIIFEFEDSTSDYHFRGHILDESIMFNKISFPNEQNIIIGKKKGLFKRPYRIEIDNSNPYMKVANLRTYTFEKKWYEKPGYVFLAGVLTGTIIINLK